ncbi:type II secretion system F family protein [Neobacillus niacini]|uniref:type II secretion system F family protein n=1 Tax=Neobacillus niacini TaxID=86668 RepID=UPI001C8D6346|nr:type II secretion system F family protein [Neobacillus niacini]MBY0144974.1 type II secretion system F family protein [Neobacillus niacini]
MEIIIFAVAAVSITGLIFVLMDKRKKNSDAGSKETSSSDLNIKKSNSPELIDYSVYHLSKNEKITAILVGAFFCFLVGYLFYMNVIVAAIFSLLGFYFTKIRRVQLRDKRKRELTLQFKQMLFSLSSALSAGKSVDQAFKEIVKDLRLLYPDPNTYIIRELELINRRIANGDNIVSAIKDFSDRADSDDITNFSDVFITSTSTGGDLVEIISRTSTIISEKLEVQQEIQILVSGKKLESNVLILAPLGIIAFMSFAGNGYMDPLYEFPGAGPVIMTACIAVLGFVYWVLRKIMDIRV